VSDIHEKLLAAFQIEHREHVQAVRAMLDDLARKEFDAQTFDFVEAHRRVHSLKGAARAVGLRPLEALAHRLETLMSDCQTGALALDREVAGVIHRAFDSIEDFTAELKSAAEPVEPTEALAALERLLNAKRRQPAGDPRSEMDEKRDNGVFRPIRAAAEPRSEAARGTSAFGTIDTTRVDVDSLDDVLKHASEILSEDLHHERISVELRELQQEIATLARDTAGIAGVPGIAASALNTVLDRAKAVSLMQRDAAWRLKKLGGRLYRDVRELRIVPAESVFGGVRKMVRDLAQAERKQVEIEVEGLETRADRQVLQALKDPVMHLLRNAVSHGIEAPDVRMRRGKPAAGRIAIKMATQGNRLIIRIADDGYGLDRARIVKEALRRGVLREDASVAGNVVALTPLLVQPGFTTAREVTEISGRGIGLSVVDKAVRQLQGTFDLSPGERAGTVASVAVPLMVASHRLLLAQCNGHTYAIPTHNVQRLCRFAVEGITTVNGKSMIVSEDEDDPLPLASLAQLLGHTDTAVDSTGTSILVVSLRSGPARLGVAVDRLVGVQDAIVHDLDGALRKLSLVMGGIILADGGIATVINPTALIESGREPGHQWSFDKRPPVESRKAPLIMVVDDSITTRTLEKSILEARGFRVRLSVDGVDALEKLSQEPVDLVIADIEMPRMDGFELLHAMKGDQRVAEIPVILVTSRDNAQDRRKGLALGADAYIVKQRFDQSALIETIDQIL
jgi:two-component system chemotaxis sensor kinase CheA